MNNSTISDNFLIDSWFPFGEVSVESIRERSPGTDFPAPNRLHVWFARRPLTTSRATILCSLIKSKDRENILKILGIPPNKDLLEAQRKMDEAKSTKIRIDNPFTWKKAYNHTPTDSELEWLHTELKKVWGRKITNRYGSYGWWGKYSIRSNEIRITSNCK